jgi:hypothetical protein
MRSPIIVLQYPLKSEQEEIVSVCDFSERNAE